MGTGVPWAKCWLLLSTISSIYSTGDVAQNGTEVEFNGLRPGANSTEIEENNYINLTVRLNDQNVLHIKISQQQNNLTVDLCKFSLKTVCVVSDSSSPSSHCQCLNNHTVQFLKKASSSDSGLYTWTWRDGQTPEKQRDFFITVKKANTSTSSHSDYTATTTTTTIIMYVAVSVVVVATAGVVLCLRGTEVEFEGLGPGDNSREIEQNNYINLTVHLKNQNVLYIKISYQQNNLSLDFCKFYLKTTCEMSDLSHASSHCQCLNNLTVQFLKKASSSDSGLYTWTWRDGGTQDKHRDFFITVIKGNGSDDTASAATTATIVCVLLTVVVTATAGVVLWMRNKAKCSIEVRDCGRYYRSKCSDHVVDNQVSGQTVNTVDNHHSSVVNEPTSNHSHDPNYADIHDTIHPNDPNYDNIKEQDSSQPPEPSCYSVNVENTSDDSPYAHDKKQDKIQLTDTTKHSVNIKDASPPFDPYYSDIMEPTMSHDNDNNNTNDTEHDESHNFEPNYADINELETSQPHDLENSNINQHSSHNCDPNYTEVKVNESSKPDDPNFAHVKQIMRPPHNSTDAQVKTRDTIQPNDPFYNEDKRQEASLAVNTMYPHVNRQETELESSIAYSPKDEQKPVITPHSPTFAKQDTTTRDDYYNHLHEIHQHDDPNYDHILTSTRQSADLTFQQVKGHNDLSYPNVKRENTI